MCACVQVFNPTGFSCHVEAGSVLGGAVEAKLVEVEQHPPEGVSQEASADVSVRRIPKSEVEQRKKRLCEIVGKPELLTAAQTEQLHHFLGEHHEAFSLDPNE